MSDNPLYRFVWRCLLLAALVPLTLLGQENAPQPMAAPIFEFPEDGAWYANDGSFTGFYFDVQNGQLAGTYFGFDNDGENVWLTFSGELDPLFDLTQPDRQIGWQLESTLMQFFNGNCILDCTAPNSDGIGIVDAASISFQFDGRSRGRFSVNESGVTDIIPLYFGNPARISEQAAGLTALPDLEGTWVVTITTDILPPFSDMPPLTADLDDPTGIIEIGPQQVTDSPADPALSMIITAPILSDTTPRGLQFPDRVAEIHCEFPIDTTGTSAIDCFIIEDIFNDGQRVRNFDVPVQAITDSRFQMNFVAIDADTLEIILTRGQAFRTGYD